MFKPLPVGMHLKQEVKRAVLEVQHGFERTQLWFLILDQKIKGNSICPSDFSGLMCIRCGNKGKHSKKNTGIYLSKFFF